MFWIFSHFKFEKLPFFRMAARRLVKFDDEVPFKDKVIEIEDKKYTLQEYLLLSEDIVHHLGEDILYPIHMFMAIIRINTTKIDDRIFEIFEFSEIYKTQKSQKNTVAFRDQKISLRMHNFLKELDTIDNNYINCEILIRKLLTLDPETARLTLIYLDYPNTESKNPI